MSVYLDQAATYYPKPEVVYRAVDRFMREVGVSPGRGAYRRGLEADRVVYETRRSLARLFNCHHRAPRTGAEGVVAGHPRRPVTGGYPPEKSSSAITSRPG